MLVGVEAGGAQLIGKRGWPSLVLSLGSPGLLLEIPLGSESIM